MPPFKIVCFDEVTSTNETILLAGERGETEWTVHLARSQSRGRGRGSHRWWSPAGRGLWMSVLLYPRSAPSRLGGLAIVAGAAVRCALESLGARGIDVYWPNDLQFKGRKLGGILCEAHHWGGEPRRVSVALGIGVNIDLEGIEVLPELRGSIASLSETGPAERSPRAISSRILEHLYPLYKAFEGGVRISTLVEGRISGIGRCVTVRSPHCGPWEGSVLGIGDEGELMVERKDGEIARLHSAEVEYR